MRTLTFAVAFALAVSACDAAAAPETHSAVAESAASTEPRPDTAEPAPDDAQQPDPDDAQPDPDTAPAASMTLRLPRPGTDRAAVIAEVPECGEQLDPAGTRCRFHGWIDPLPAACEDGCTWWTYQFAAAASDGAPDRALEVARLERAEWDVDDERVQALSAEASEVARELSRTLGVPAEVEHLASWREAESSSERHRTLLERRRWRVDGTLTTWAIFHHPGHHPGFVLEVQAEPIAGQIPR